jgi:hypothetical protein
MANIQTYTRRDNAVVAAKKLLAAGEAPGASFTIERGADDRFAINWQAANTEQIATEIAAATAAADQRPDGTAVLDATHSFYGAHRLKAETVPAAVATEIAAAGSETPAAAESEIAAAGSETPVFETENKWPDGTAVLVRVGRRRLNATIVERIREGAWQVRWPAGDLGTAAAKDIRRARKAPPARPVKSPATDEPATSNGALTGIKGRILDLLLQPTGATEPEVCAALGWKQAGATIGRTIRAAVATGHYAVDKTRDGRVTRYTARRL